MSDRIVVEGVEISFEAAKLCEYVRCSPAKDVERLRTGEITRKELLAECLKGAEGEDCETWKEYVVDVAIAAGRAK